MENLTKFVLILCTTGLAGTLLTHPVGWMLAMALAPMIAYRVIRLEPHEPY